MTSLGALLHRLWQPAGWLRVVTGFSANGKAKESSALQLQVYCERASGLMREKDREIRSILGILAQAAHAMGERSGRSSCRFRELARELESVSELDDMAQVRRRLAESVTKLRSISDSAHCEEMATEARMQNELESFQRRLLEAETHAASDALTGLANRREAERLMRARIHAGQPFSVMLFDLDGFKLVNDRYGHTVGDHILKAFAVRLSSLFRPGDAACRWGGDEFLVLLDSDATDLASRSQAVAERMRGLYSVQSAKGTLAVEVSASVGVAQFEPGESCEELFARADALLYQKKKLHWTNKSDLSAPLTKAKALPIR